MNIDILTIEIGSTITKINAFDNMNKEPVHLGQALDLTTVEQGDVSIGVEKAINNLEKDLGEKINASEYLINSSAAGGLKMAVQGLTHDMTAKAAREASLGAGAIIRYIGSGKIADWQLEEIREISPNILLLAGGLDYGDTEITLENAKRIASLDLDIPLIYAGNSQLVKPVTKIFSDTLFKLSITDNVYPDVDNLNTFPARRIIQQTFSEHIIHSEGMEKLSGLTRKEVIPTPYAVLKITEYLYEHTGPTTVIDVGGATTDIHSVCEDLPENSVKRIEPEPVSKRTVEGDLGVYINAENLNSIKDRFNDYCGDLKLLKPMPGTEKEVALSASLTEKAVNIALRRHCGRKKVVFGPSGKKEYITGKDLSGVKFLIGTGGALTRLDNTRNILKKQILAEHDPSDILLPRGNVRCLTDHRYIFSSLGTIAFHNPGLDLRVLIAQSTGLEDICIRG
ncbi:MAG: glutamate mutase L [Candidatus Muiribacteriaceae bacterium]